MKEILDEMQKITVFNGTFDATNGSWEFMHGVACVMEYLAYQVSEEYFEEFQEKFWKNFEKSIDKAQEKRYNKGVEREEDTMTKEQILDILYEASKIAEEIEANARR